MNETVALWIGQSAALTVIAVMVLFWAKADGQFEDLDRAARIPLEEDDLPPPEEVGQAGPGLSPGQTWRD